ncbi:hypothetical protein [Bacillus atrophaeus]|uniref:hypothetical protein n=1 Tax=Bacillus atrophaeus TaxID=1452 RepID=UPI002161EC41|nr:hypothetical protein [Bacillus atrophaeus]
MAAKRSSNRVWGQKGFACTKVLSQKCFLKLKTGKKKKSYLQIMFYSRNVRLYKIKKTP